MNEATAFYATVTNKNGKPLFKSKVHPTRAAAVAEAFAARPKARSCSTSRVTLRTMGGIEYILDGHMDIQFHDKD